MATASPFTATNGRFRKTYGKLSRILEIPDLIAIQKKSYDKFLQTNVKPTEREDVGLQGVFKSVFPIKDFNETASLEFVSYSFEPPKYEVDECRQRGMTFAAPLKVVVRLVIWEQDEDGNAQNIRDVKEQEVYFGEIPLMTSQGTFIVNGTERVVVSQLHRSPGVSFDVDKGKNLLSGVRTSFAARIIPYRGSWLDFEFDAKDLVYVRIDRRRKMFATILLKALGYSEQELLNYFYKAETYDLSGKKSVKNVILDALPSQIAHFDVKDSSGKVIVKKGKRFTKFALRNVERAGIKELATLEEEMIGRIAAENIVDPKTGEVLLECNQELTEEKLEKIKAAGVFKLKLIFVNNLTVFSSLRDTLLADKVSGPDEGILEIYKRMRPGDPPTPEACKVFFQNLFFKPDKYDLSQVGRLKINHKFNLNVPLDHRVLTKEDILEVVHYLLDLKSGKGEVDDIDHLGNRRVRSVSELLENQYRIGLVRMERAIRERMSLQELETLMPHELINAKPVSAVVKEFFGSSQLSQFMDQTNPLCEITHKRRLSALGPGGLTRDRAGFEVRDVHSTHYGRICPIETPEGPNIGLIASLATYARVNDFGFIETPYRVVKNGVVTTEIIYCSALDEQNRTIAQANAPLDEKGRFTMEAVSCRRSGEPVLAKPEDIDLMDVSPNQLVSVAASLVPFLEHDDANRALMGSNMQRQAVPLIKTNAPLVGTGIENIVARDSGVTAVARHSGWVDSVDASRIVVRVDRNAPENKEDIDIQVGIYNLIKYQRSNQNTAISQKPIVKKGDYVRKGDVIADGQATDCGELALGQNVTVAFMSWGGYNFEDSILISERVVKEDTFTSVHIEEFEIAARDTKLGMEEITRDIPNVGEEALRNLDESGIIRIGAAVKPGDILVGKVTPKGETQLSPEEKLLRAIFGEKAADVKDTSLRVPPGVVGTVIDARVFSREGVEKDTRAKAIEEQDAAKILKDQEDEIKIIKNSAYDRIRELLLGKRVSANTKNKDGNIVIEKGKAITEAALSEIPKIEWHKISLANEAVEGEIRGILQNLNDRAEKIKILSNARLEKLRKGDELPPGVIKLVKSYVAIKRKLSVGDKMAGRHGNKGVVSCILPEEDMPYMADGTPVDIVLNPLGVPSRMNVGQLLETHLGWGAKKMGDVIQQYLDRNYNSSKLKSFILDVYEGDKEVKKFLDVCNEDELKQMACKLTKGVHVAVPVFEGTDEAEITRILEKMGQAKSGQMILFDGRDGRPFDRPVTVGMIYMMKLHHIVDDKIHARSIGPYSIVTQQPLGGKAQFGGQRLGEMEVWAMEAYGAAYALQEFLTVKSDDIVGRTRMYEAIVKGENTLEPGLPESFNVLCTELKGLGLNVELVYDEMKEKMA